MKWFTRTLLGTWIVLLAFDGFFRYACTTASLPWLAYLKDVVSVALLGAFAVRSVGRLRLHLVVLAAVGIITYGAVVGLLYGISAVAVAFAVKMFLPFLVGYLAMAQGYLDSAASKRLYRWVTPCIALGVLLDLVVVLPWTGLSYDLANVTLEASREWTTFGLQRPAGFGRSSFETAIALYTLLVLRFGIRDDGETRDRRLPRAYDAILAIASVTAIGFTTSKTSILALCLFCVTLLLRAGMRHSWVLFRHMSRIALSTVMVFALVLTLVPFFIPQGTANQLDDTLSKYGLIPKLMFQSLVERAQDVWPRAAHSMSPPLLSLTGRGLGGVGAPQLYFAPDQYNPADNVHVYLWLSFGIVILLLLVAGLGVLIGRLARAPAPDAALVSFLATLLAFGATLNVIEAPMLMLGLGILLAAHEGVWNDGH